MSTLMIQTEQTSLSDKKLEKRRTTTYIFKTKYFTGITYRHLARTE